MMSKRNRRGHHVNPIYDMDADRLRPDGTKTDRTQPEPTLSSTWHGVDETFDVWYTPPLESVLISIMLEIAEEREAGRVKPFIEVSLPKLVDNKYHRRRGMGEPIGVIQKSKPFVQRTETEADRYERRQEEVRALRAKNDAAMRRILEN